jgi:hypothetical protein
MRSEALECVHDSAAASCERYQETPCLGGPVERAEVIKLPEQQPRLRISLHTIGQE